MKKIVSVVLALLMLIPAICLSASDTGYDPEMPFADAVRGSWYYSAVKYCTKNGFLNGVTDTAFEPDSTLTRAMFVRAIANMEKVDLSLYDNEESSFYDVNDGAWFASAVKWAFANGIVSGYNDGSFRPDNYLTRAEMAQLFYNYASYKKMDTDIKIDLDVFSDRGSIPQWAEDAIAFAAGIELVVGDANRNFNAEGNATRAQLAQVIYRFYYKLTYNSTIPDTKDADNLMVTDGNDRIVCWGDSLTVGINSTPFPTLLQNEFKIPVKNYGVGGETSGTIAMRQGAIPFYVEPVTIPAEKSKYVPIELVGDDGGSDVGVFGDKGVNYVYIGGVKGNIVYKEEDSQLYFVRSEAGDEVVLTNRTRVITRGMWDRKSGDILVLFVGTNNGYSAAHVQELIELQEDMIAYAGVDRYVIIGFTSLDYMSEVDAVNAALKEYWGEHFVDLREYMMTEQCLIDNGITPTETDLADLERGEIPASLRIDSVHGNQTFYNIIAQMVAAKIRELGYLS